jgi:hypothetical protein
MTTATRIGNGRAVGRLPEDPGFRRRHRVLAWLLAVHLPALAGLAVLTGRLPSEALVEGAVVVVALAVGAFPDLSPRLRALALTVGLLWCSVVVGLFTATLVWGLLHGGIVGLMAAAHLGSAWRARPSSPPEEESEEHPDQVRIRLHDSDVEQSLEVGVAERTVDEHLVEVREIYTGVWSAKHLVRPRTRLVRLPTPSVTADADGDGYAAPADAMTVEANGSATPHAATPSTGEEAHATQADLVPIVSEPRDPNLTREVLEALHLGATEEPAHTPREHVSSGQPR